MVPWYDRTGHTEASDSTATVSDNNYTSLPSIEAIYEPDEEEVPEEPLPWASLQEYHHPGDLGHC